MRTETLHCVAGNHTWERELKRGVKPSNCPTHSAPKSEPRERTVTENAQAEIEFAREVAAEYLGEEARRQVAYITENLLSGRREAADETLLRDRLRDILRPAVRMLNA